MPSYLKAFLFTFVLNIKNMQSFSGIFNFQGIQSFDLLKKLGFTNNHTEEILLAKEPLFEFIAVKNLENKLSQTNIYTCEESDLLISGEIRIYNLNELLELLKCTYANNHQIVLECYKKWGENCSNFINGDFSFVIWDKKMEQLFCSRDPLGQKPFFYSLDTNGFIFSTNFQNIQKLSSEKIVLNLDWIAYFMIGKYDKIADTVFNSIKRLEPGHSILLDKKEFKISRYWEIDKQVVPLISDTNTAIELLKNEIVRSVECRSDFNLRAGIELSGGLDSSLVGAIAQKLYQKESKDIDAFTNVMSEESKKMYPLFYDEWDKASEVAKNSNIENHFALDSPVADPIGLIDLMLEKNGQPSNFHFSVLQKGIYDQAKKRGDTILFSGFGGDELVSSNSTSRYEYTVYKNKGMKSLFISYRTRGYSLFATSIKFSKFLVKRMINFEQRFKNKIYFKQNQLNILNDEICNKYASQFYQSCYYPINQTISQREVFHLNSGALIERLETGYQLTNNSNINYSFPLLDTRLIAFYHFLSDKIKGENLKSRFIFREVCKDYLPNKITNQAKPSNSMTMPFNKIEMINEMKTLADYCLRIPNSNTVFNYVDPVKLKSLIGTIDFEKGDNKQYKMLFRTIMLSRFFDKHNL
jgi:asparagine synthase (glutamine-hydrolysing)